MKIPGMLLIILSGAALGAEAGRSLRRHWQSLEELKSLIIFLKGEIQYGAAPLGELFFRLSDKADGSLPLFFRETAKEMAKEDHIPLEEILRKKAKDFLGESGLTEKEKKRLVKVCTQMGRLDRMTQIGTLEGYLYEILQEEQTAMEKVKQKETMYRCLGIMGGLFLAVLLY